MIDDDGDAFSVEYKRIHDSSGLLDPGSANLHEISTIRWVAWVAPPHSISRLPTPKGSTSSFRLDCLLSLDGLAQPSNGEADSIPT